MVLSAFLVSDMVTPHIRGKLATLAGPSELYGASTVKQERLQPLLHLLRDYVPALFYLGYRVRTLHWRRHQVWTGADAPEILQFSTVILLALREKQGRQQYLDATLLALLQWQPFMDVLPGAAFCEEKLESTLNELQKGKDEDPTIITVGKHQKQYRYLNRKANESRDIADPHVARTWPVRVRYRTRRLIATIVAGTVPHMPLTCDVTSTSRPSSAWPQSYTFPDRLWVSPPKLTVKVHGVK